MVALLGPVDAVADQWPPARERGEVDAERVQPLGAGGGQPVVHIGARSREAVGARGVGVEQAVAAGENAAVEQTTHQARAEHAREMVATGAGEAQLRRRRVLAQ